MPQTNEISQGRIFRHSGRPSVIGHRGLGSGIRDGHTENTISSLLAAADAGADWVEIDIRRTADDQLVLHHDPAIDGAVISGLAAADPKLSKLLRFDDFLAQVPPTLGLDIEIKPDLIDSTAELSTVDLMADVYRNADVPNPTLFKSFDAASVADAGNHFPDIATAFLTWANYPLEFAVITAARLKANAICVHVSSLGSPTSQEKTRAEIARALQKCAEIDIEVMVWGVKPADVNRLTEQGVSALVVDDVAETVQILANNR